MAVRSASRTAAAIERLVARMPRCRYLPLTRRQLDALLSTGHYVPARGLQAGRHFRKPRGRGCYHIRIHPRGGADIHRDGWDPRRYPMLHLFETPQLWIPGAVLTILMLLLAA